MKNNHLTTEEFKIYLLEGKIKIDKINDILVQDIINNQKNDFLNKWNLFLLKNYKVQDLNFNKVWITIIEEKKTEWIENINLPVNKYNSFMYHISKKLLYNFNDENIKVFEKLKEKVKSKSSLIKNIEDIGKINQHAQMLVRLPSEKHQNILEAIIFLDEKYRECNPQNPDKFLTYMIISLGKESEMLISDRNWQEKTNLNLLTELDVVNTILVPLMDRLIEFDGMGTNKLVNKKDSQSLNQVYHLFQKYYKTVKLYEKLEIKLSESNKIKKPKI